MANPHVCTCYIQGDTENAAAGTQGGGERFADRVVFLVSGNPIVALQGIAE